MEEVEEEEEVLAPGLHGSGRGGGELARGYKLVPWSSWDQWLFVHDRLFSSDSHSAAAALGRITAWRSRGSLPMPIDVTAALIEIRRKDPAFRMEEAAEGDVMLESEEMLAMLYSMAIVRFVNGFVEQLHKKRGRSVFESAEAVGIPRVLVDIRHESSHRNLPSLRLLRLASTKALDWLKFYYWEPQKNAIPDVQGELRSRLHELAYHLKTKHAKKPSPDTKGKRTKQSFVLGVGTKLSLQVVAKKQLSRLHGSEKHISRTIKYIVRLYSLYPSEVVYVLLEFLQLDASGSLNTDDVEYSNFSDIGRSGPVLISINDWKTVITGLSTKEPRLLLRMLKAVLEMIENKGAARQNGEICTSEPCCPATCSLVLWLVTNLKSLKESGHIGLVHEIGVVSSNRNDLPRFCIAKLLQKCLSLSIVGKRHLIDAVLILLEMIGNDAVKEKLKKLPLLRFQNRSLGDFAPSNCGTVPVEEDSVEKAAEKLENYKLQLKKRRDENTGSVGDNTENTSPWTLAKSWIPCPIGMLPCSFSSTAVLPSLDVHDDELKDKVTAEEDREYDNNSYTEGDDICSVTEQLADDRLSKRMRTSPEDHVLDISEPTLSMEGKLLIDGVWMKPNREEFFSIQSKIRILL